MDPKLLQRILEAALLAAAQPLSLPQLSALFGENEGPTHEELARAIEALQHDCAERGIELKEVASGFRYQVREDVHAWVARLWTERQTKYSRALLETLALIAYRQPITRAEIEQIRGVAVSSNMVRTLEEREWVRVVGYRDVPGKPALFGTTRNFLDYFNLKSLDQLPPLAEIRDIEDFDPQLNLGPVASDAPVPRAIERFDEEIAAEADAALSAANDDAQLDDGAADETDTAPHDADDTADFHDSPPDETDDAVALADPSDPMAPEDAPEHNA